MGLTIKLRNLFTAISFVAVIGFSMAGCDAATDSDDGTTYTVTFNANGGSGTGPDPITVQIGSSTTLPGGVGLTKSGSTFGGWNTNAAGTGTNYNTGDSYTPTGNITLYAKWNDASTSYTVTFNANGGSGTGPDPITVQIGSSITIPGGNGLTKSGFNFGGWNINTAGTGTNYSAGSPYTPTGDITLYAKWNSDSAPINDVTVIPATITVAKGRTLLFNAIVPGSYSAFTWEVTGGGNGTSISTDGRLTVAANEPAATLTVKATSTADTSKSGTAIVTVTNPINYSVNDQTSWIAAVNGVRNGGNNKAHIITVTNDFSVTTSSGNDNTFGDVTGITVYVEGDYTITAAANGRLLYIGGEQAAILKDITLQGRSNNTNELVRINYSFNWDTYESFGGIFIMTGSASVTGNTSSTSGGGVYVSSSGSGTFIMQDNATVTGNTVNTSSTAYGGGVDVNSYGIFIMQGDAAVTNNTANCSGANGYAYGGGVIVNGTNSTFIMKDNATVSDNTASVSYSVNFAAGGGVVVRNDGDFTMEGGSISRNTATGLNYGDARGGGVYVDLFNSSTGTFTMYDGTISGNTAKGHSAYGGGVFGTLVMENGAITGNTVTADYSSGSGIVEAYGGGVYGYGDFIMKDGVISDNTVSGRGAYSNGNTMVYAVGGGVFGRFTMQGGAISGNTLSAINTYSSSNITVRGGGVCVSGNLTKTGGTIYGNDASEESLKNIANDGKGHAVYSNAYVGENTWRNATAGPTMNSNTYGFWTNEPD